MGGSSHVGDRVEFFWVLSDKIAIEPWSQLTLEVALFLIKW